MTATPQQGRPDPELPGLLPALLLTDEPTGARSRPVRRSIRDWIVDVLCFLIAVGFGVLTVLEFTDDGMTSWRVVDIVIGAALCLALWVRRRWPVQLAVACVAASFLFETSAGALLISIFTVAVHRRFPVAGAIGSVAILSAAIYYWHSPTSDSSWTASFIFSALFIIIAVVWGMLVRARRQLVLSLRDRARHAEAEAHLRVEQAQQRERQRIAREMHDVLAHRLSLLSVHANALVHRRDAPAEDVVQASTVIRESAHQALQDLREVIGVLRASSAPDGSGEPQPTLDDLATLIAESRQAGMQIAVDDWRGNARDDADGEVEGDARDDAHSDAPLPTAVSRCGYRVVQEGLTNARKHAPGSAVAVALSGTPGEALTVNVRNAASANDAGSGSDRIPGSGTGLVGLRERASLAGGTLTYGPTADGGFMLTADLPWPQQ